MCPTWIYIFSLWELTCLKPQRFWLSFEIPKWWILKKITSRPIYSRVTFARRGETWCSCVISRMVSCRHLKLTFLKFQTVCFLLIWIFFFSLENIGIQLDKRIIPLSLSSLILIEKMTFLIFRKATFVTSETSLEELVPIPARAGVQCWMTLLLWQSGQGFCHWVWIWREI